MKILETPLLIKIIKMPPLDLEIQEMTPNFESSHKIIPLTLFHNFFVLFLFSYFLNFVAFDSSFLGFHFLIDIIFFKKINFEPGGAKWRVSNDLLQSPAS